MAQWDKHWPTDLAVLRLIVTRGEILLNGNQGSIAHSLSLPVSSAHRPVMTEILLKRT